VVLACVHGERPLRACFFWYFVSLPPPL
jgi:hypothetical protein